MHCMALSMAISRSLVDLERSQDRLLFWRSVKRCLLAAQVQLIVNDYGKQDDRALLPRSYMFYFCLKFLGALAGWKSLSSLRHVSRREETAWQEDFVQHGRSWECFRSKCKVIVGHLDFLSIAHFCGHDGYNRRDGQNTPTSIRNFIPNRQVSSKRKFQV